MFSKADLGTCHQRGGRGGCGQPIRWTMTKAGKAFAVDPDPHPEGNTAVMRDAGGTLRSRRVTAELPLLPYERLMMPHAATCRPQRTRASQEPPPHPPRSPRLAQPRAGALYAALDVSPTATPEEIRTAYRRLARQLHPDLNPADDARERFKAVTEAYDVLSNPDTRAAYDLTGRRPRGA
ncbi:J domain-containing protein [Nonomuraea sp. bgisy101]|uniref:J domain-containing protein n=1 Tax=Nonomuraea sp. bgisy101 TaxID=3413784 RepID=UPI003D7064AD